MIEYCYKLNLPIIEDVVISLDQIKHLIPENFQGSKIFYPEPQDIFKPEWLSYKDLSWDYVSLFFRSGKNQSVLHRDNVIDRRILHWGINWVLGSDSIMEYWQENTISQEKIIYDSGGKTTVFLDTVLPPCKSYVMSYGVYLVNASIPHRITNLSDNLRIAISLRSKKYRYENPNIAWNEIVDTFSDVI